MIAAIRTVMQKELRESFRDRRTLLNSLLIGPIFAPLFFILILKLALSRSVASQDEMTPVTVANAAAAPNLVQQLRVSGMTVTLRDGTDAEIRAWIADTDALVVLSIPGELRRALRRGQARGGHDLCRRLRLEGRAARGARARRGRRLFGPDREPAAAGSRRLARGRAGGRDRQRRRVDTLRPRHAPARHAELRHHPRDHAGRPVSRDRRDGGRARARIARGAAHRACRSRASHLRQDRGGSRHDARGARARDRLDRVCAPCRATRDFRHDGEFRPRGRRADIPDRGAVRARERRAPDGRRIVHAGPTRKRNPGSASCCSCRRCRSRSRASSRCSPRRA